MFNSTIINFTRLLFYIVFCNTAKHLMFILVINILSLIKMFIYISIQDLVTNKIRKYVTLRYFTNIIKKNLFSYFIKSLSASNS